MRYSFNGNASSATMQYGRQQVAPKQCSCSHQTEPAGQKICFQAGHTKLETLGLTHRGGSLGLRQRPRSRKLTIPHTILRQCRSTNASAEGPAKKISTANDAIPEYTTNTENYKH
ncbi:hypothetical protein UPYG_G00079660 [Umbra pygmaea]|uniref:Uncharacterized protein n=1 Tax=Umbra pygmaea TaxID=75934 RepID=A0ABD0Y2V4_UMBPY